MNILFDFYFLIIITFFYLKSKKPDRKFDANGKPIEDYWPAAKRVISI